MSNRCKHSVAKYVPKRWQPALKEGAEQGRATILYRQAAFASHVQTLQNEGDVPLIDAFHACNGEKLVPISSPNLFKTGFSHKLVKHACPEGSGDMLRLSRGAFVLSFQQPHAVLLQYPSECYGERGRHCWGDRVGF